MSETMNTKGSIPDIILNTDGLYKGDLVHYFRIVFRRANNLQHPYHNFKHMFHVLWLCYGACLFYRETLNKRQMRNILIAALFHDFNHTGKGVQDSINIDAAIAGFGRHRREEDYPFLASITYFIRMTEFPHTVPSNHLDLSAQILRDADLSQAFSVAWIQQVIFGLAEEWGKTPLEVLQMQEGFIGNLKFSTDWAKTIFTEENISNKVEEARKLLDILAE